MSVNMCDENGNLTRVDGVPLPLKTKDISFVFKDHTWNATSSGKYSTVLDEVVPEGSTILSVSIAAWYYMRTTDNIIPSILGRKIQVMSNVNTFAHNDSQYLLRILYV